MAAASDKTTGGTVNKAAAKSGGAHDRVAMLSIRADGTPDQVNPEIIGDKEYALAATKRQLREQAVSAVDQEKRPDLLGTAGAADEDLVQDPAIQELKDAHDAAAEQADKDAAAIVDKLYQG